jgi:hypothetical protein
MPLEGLISIIDEEIPNRPGIQPMSSISDKIGATGHGGASFRGLATRRMPSWLVIVK